MGIVRHMRGFELQYNAHFTSNPVPPAPFPPAQALVLINDTLNELIAKCKRLVRVCLVRCLRHAVCASNDSSLKSYADQAGAQ